MLSDKKQAKLEKILGMDKVRDLEGASVDELRVVISNSAASIKQAQDELEANTKFQELKEGLKAISESLKEVKKHQNATIQYALSLLEDKGAE